ncbi:MAG: aspartate aminotransferase family protein, partial [Bacillota bacterium]
MKSIQEIEGQYIINTYNRQPDLTPCLLKGKGSYVWDEKGKKYLDFLGGLAVNVVGHCHPDVVGAISKQAASLIHTSNLYYSGPQAELAGLLVENTLPGGKVFFANSGAEANEAAIKLARKNKPERYKIITAEHSFHGRTLATITATGQPKYQKPFKPLLEGFSYGKFNDLDSFAQLVDSQTAAVMIEPIQGEGGVYVAEDSFILGLRELCDHYGILLIFDEIQCGMGRTGKLWAFENWLVKPDLITVAKGLGGGLPIGAMVVSEPYAFVLQPGEHASTFGGNPVVCSAALAVLNILLEDGFLETVVEKGLIIKENLQKMIADYPALAKEYRGMG